MITLRPADYDADPPGMYAITRKAHLSSAYEELIPASELQRFRQYYAADNKVWHLERFQQMLLDTDYRVTVAEFDGALAGYAIVQKTENLYKLADVFVDPTYHGYGVGSQLLQQALNFVRARPCWLKVLAGNIAAQRLYERYGFKKVDQDGGMFFGAQLVKMERV